MGLAYKPCVGYRIYYMGHNFNYAIKLALHLVSGRLYTTRLRPTRQVTPRILTIDIAVSR